ncbi:MAG: TolC family protein [Candidatus Omnitrophica bacterium]|nr:TolC family protein [Candidatus Omnitrophota bacterium]
MRIKYFLLFLIMVFFSLSGLGYAAEAVQLAPLLKEAGANNPEVLAAKKRWEASQARIPQAKAWEDPAVTFEFDKIPRGTFKLDKTMPEDRMLSIAQTMPFFGKLPLKGKIAVIEAQMFAAEFRSKETEVANDVKNGYYDLFMNYKEEELDSQILLILQAVSRVAKARCETGAIAQQDLFKIDLEIARFDNRIANLRQERSAKETGLNALLNRPSESALGAPQLSEDFSFDKDIASLYKLTLENQAELLIFSYAIEKNKYARDLAKRNLFPDLMSEITLRGLTTGSFGLWDLMLSFTVPVWYWTKQKYEIKEAINNLEEAKAAYQAMKNKALARTKDLYVKAQVARQKIVLYKNNLIPFLESSIGSSLAGFRSGKGDSMMLLDNIRMLIETKMEYYKALVEYNMNLADLEKAVGTDLREGKNEK